VVPCGVVKGGQGPGGKPARRVLLFYPRSGSKRCLERRLVATEVQQIASPVAGRYSAQPSCGPLSVRLFSAMFIQGGQSSAVWVERKRRATLRPSHGPSAGSNTPPQFAPISINQPTAIFEPVRPRRQSDLILWRVFVQPDEVRCNCRAVHHHPIRAKLNSVGQAALDTGAHMGIAVSELRAASRPYAASTTRNLRWQSVTQLAQAPGRRWQSAEQTIATVSGRDRTERTVATVVSSTPITADLGENAHLRASAFATMQLVKPA